MATEDTKRWAEEKLQLVSNKVKKELERLGNAIPYIPFNESYTDVSKERGIEWWTNGFWGGLLWQLAHATGDDVFVEAAIAQEKRLDEALYLFRDIQHDVGFMWLHTAVAHYRETGNEQAFRTGLHAANLLAGRFNVDGNYLVAWNDQKPGWVIIDSMMNIPLLYWATAQTKDPRFEKIARRHANTVAKYLVREDGSVGHIASFDANSGEFIGLIGGQGYSSDSAWSRGNAWAIYGFALSYHHTKDPYYLSIAKRVANYFMAHIYETDNIPLVDFRAPKMPVIYDTSAGLCAACGLLEIAKWVLIDEQDHYERAAIRMLKAIEEKYANWNEEEDGIIGGGTEAYHRPATYEVPLIYSDYFFTEALLRLLEKELFIW
ncbi:glycoside hydrolase family 88 protein [Neobacillus dielmonensis]|uniref:glycoside hydrolase family 88 protein n=1 Tax=Neobacillus dielmonensis TaxID=1347369 RepID=UPI0005A9AEDF|nr:glycoside hydrolase family 88 protein [Neobacillus dielmonensis]